MWWGGLQPGQASLNHISGWHHEKLGWEMGLVTASSGGGSTGIYRAHSKEPLGSAGTSLCWAPVEEERSRAQLPAQHRQDFRAPQGIPGPCCRPLHASPHPCHSSSSPSTLQLSPSQPCLMFLPSTPAHPSWSRPKPFSEETSLGL